MKLPTRPVKTLSDTANHISGVYSVHVSLLLASFALCVGGLASMPSTGQVLAASPTPLLLLSLLPSAPAPRELPLSGSWLAPHTGVSPFLDTWCYYTSLHNGSAASEWGTRSLISLIMSPVPSQHIDHAMLSPHFIHFAY